MENAASLFSQINPSMLIGVLLVFIGLLVVYYILLVGSILEMLRVNAHSVLLVFSFLSLIPAPFILILGILIIIIWRLHRKTFPEFQ